MAYSIVSKMTDSEPYRKGSACDALISSAAAELGRGDTQQRSFHAIYRGQRFLNIVERMVARL